MKSTKELVNKYKDEKNSPIEIMDLEEDTRKLLTPAQDNAYKTKEVK